MKRTNQKAQVNTTEEGGRAAISIRDVEKKVWYNFKKLAMIHDMNLQDYLKFVVDKELSNVQISK